MPRSAVDTVRTVYRKVISQEEMCAYGDKHHVGVYDVQTITIVAEGEQPDVSGYNQGRGTSYWAADDQGRIYYRPFNGFEVGGWNRDDDVAYFERPGALWARDLEGNPLTDRTPAWGT